MATVPAPADMVIIALLYRYGEWCVCDTSHGVTVLQESGPNVREFLGRSSAGGAWCSSR